jgi:hypothetical protein
MAKYGRYLQVMPGNTLPMWAVVHIDPHILRKSFAEF